MASLLEAIEGFYLTLILTHLHRQGALERPKRDPQTAMLLEFVRRTSDVLTPSGKLAPQYRHSIGQLLDHFVRAYGGALVGLAGLSRGVDRRALSDAFTGVEDPATPMLASLVAATGARTLLELGCGTAAVLRRLCQDDSRFRGWAVDRDPHMCAAARRAGRRFSRRFRVIQADARSLDRRMPRTQRERVEAILVGSLLNELLFPDGKRCVALLRKLSRLFPGRLLITVDYLGTLTGPAPRRHRANRALLQDVVQAVTGQGVPPSDHSGWTSLYRSAGCTPIKIFEGGRRDGLRWFVHLVQL
jgi:SAM-dependent methyltransferase